MTIKISLSPSIDPRPRHLVVTCDLNEYSDVSSMIIAEVLDGVYLERERVYNTEVFRRQTGWLMRLHIKYLEKLMLCVPFSHLSEGIENMLLEEEKKRLRAIPIPNIDLPDLQRPLFDFQKIAVDRLSREDGEPGCVMLLNDDIGLGKQHPVTEPVLTPNGWRKIGSVKVGDLVIGSNGWPTTVVGVYPQKGRETYRVTFSDGTWSLCGLDHIWSVQTENDRKRGGKWRNVTVRQILEEKPISVVGSGQNRNKPYSWVPCLKSPNGHRNLSIPIVAPVHFNKRPHLEIDPYGLGVLLGDGSFAGRSGIRLCTDLEIVEKVFPTATRRQHKSPGIVEGYISTDTKWAKFIANNNLARCKSYQKFIPKHCLRLSIKERHALLQGLLDTDGTPNRSGGVLFTSTSKALVRGVSELVRSLGGIARGESSRIPTYIYKGQRRKGRRAWTINIKLPNQFEPFRLSRKAKAYRKPSKYLCSKWIESIERVEDHPSVCIKVAAQDQLYVTRHYIVTHNTGVMLSALYLRRWFPCLVAVGSVSGKYVWEREAAIMFPKLRVQVIEGSKATRDWMFRRAHLYDITICNVQALRIKETEELKPYIDENGENNVRKITHVVMSNPYAFQVDWECFVVDEYHKFKNPSAQQTKGFLRMECGRFRGLSGTPILNRPTEAWTFLHKCDPDRFPSPYFFEQEIGRFTKSGKLIGYKPEAMLKVKNWLFENSLRRRKEHVSDELPEVVTVDQVVELTPEQRKIYDRIREEMYLQLDDGSIKSIFDARVQIMRLKQACVSPELFGGSRHSAKIDQVKEDVAQLVAAGHKAIIFSEWAKAARILERELQEYNPAYVDGSVPPRERPIQEKRFNEDPTCLVYCGTIAANQEAITLSAATYVLFVDMDWVPNANTQAAGRSAAGGMRGIGVTGKVTIMRYVAEDTIEQRLAQTLWQKQKAVNAFVERDAGASMKKLTIKKLRELL